MIPFSVLDLCPVIEEGDAALALHHALDLAQHAEQWGYQRFWLAEHHNMVGVASAATSVVIGYVAQGTKTIRVGSGGIMLPNHSPLVIAEQFGTLAALYPDRIDLGVGRAPGGDQNTIQALRRSQAVDQFPQDVQELAEYFQPVQEGQVVQAVPGAGLNVPLYILGSSLYGAQLAAFLGLPFAFASHFMPDQLTEAFHIYRTNFRPSAQCEKPYAMLAVNVFAAETDQEAEFQFSSLQQQFYNLRFARPGKIQPPVHNITEQWHSLQKSAVAKALACSAVGSADTVHSRLQTLLRLHQPDEVIVTATMYNHQARLTSFQMAADILRSL